MQDLQENTYDFIEFETKSEWDEIGKDHYMKVRKCDD